MQQGKYCVKEPVSLPLPPSPLPPPASVVDHVFLVRGALSRGGGLWDLTEKSGEANKKVEEIA